MPRIPFYVSVLALAATLAAQAPAEKQEHEAAAQFRKLGLEFNKARTAWYRKQFAAARGNPRRAIPMIPTEVIEEFVPKFEEAAKQYKGTDGAVPFLTWLLTADRTPKNPHSTKALEALLTDHLASPKLSDAAARLPGLGRTLGDDVVKEAIAKILAKTPHNSVKAALYYARANLVLRNQKASADAKAAAVADMRKVVELDPKSDAASRAGGAIYEQEKLQVGMQVPDIEGEDLDGVSFRLWDYKGKVIMLDFWGDW